MTEKQCTRCTLCRVVCRPVLVDSRLVVTTEFASLHSPLGFSSGPQHWRLPFSSAAEAVEFYGRFERKARALVRLYTAEAGSDGVKVCGRCKDGGGAGMLVVDCRPRICG